MIGKLLIETNFEMIYIATSEIYPTTVSYWIIIAAAYISILFISMFIAILAFLLQARVTALGLGSSLARIGGAISPYIVLTVRLAFHVLLLAILMI